MATLPTGLAPSRDEWLQTTRSSRNNSTPRPTIRLAPRFTRTPAIYISQDPNRHYRPSLPLSPTTQLGQNRPSRCASPRARLPLHHSRPLPQTIATVLPFSMHLERCSPTRARLQQPTPPTSPPPHLDSSPPPPSPNPCILIHPTHLFALLHPRRLRCDDPTRRDPASSRRLRGRRPPRALPPPPPSRLVHFPTTMVRLQRMRKATSTRPRPPLISARCSTKSSRRLQRRPRSFASSARRSVPRRRRRRRIRSRGWELAVGSAPVRWDLEVRP